MFSKIENDIQELKNPAKAKHLAGFFKTGKGEYGEGDIFLGIQVPLQRKIALKYKDASLKDIQKLLKSKFHEYRLVALLILVEKCRKPADTKEIVDIYLKNTKHINNWDLVDLSAPKILGEYLLRKDRKILYKLAKSKLLWEKRIAVLSTFAFIRNMEFKDTINLSEILLNDQHDLMHKAVGWMLREVGKRNINTEEVFLKKYYKKMPRTMLRYAIEKFPPSKKQFYMKK
jgi:3-methyladenine DNA glycosylase AlkD